MPAKPSTPEPDPTPATTTTHQSAPAAEEPTVAAVPAGRQPPGVYQFTGSLPTQYLDVPLTAHPADAETSATIADWPFGAPDDGRWEPTKKKPTQVADNAAPLTSEE